MLRYTGGEKHKWNYEEIKLDLRTYIMIFNSEEQKKH